MFLFYYDQTGSGPVIPKTTKPYAELSVMDMGKWSLYYAIQARMKFQEIQAGFLIDVNLS